MNIKDRIRLIREKTSVNFYFQSSFWLLSTTVNLETTELYLEVERKHVDSNEEG